MHYYQHHIGDFLKDTSNLSNEQLAVYLKMLWVYYTSEKPFTDAPEDIAFAVRSDEKTVQLILRHFFVQQEDGWHQTRCDKEIAHFHSKSEKARSSAKTRWNNANACERMQTHESGESAAEIKGTKNANALPTHSERKANATKSDANQEPITNNQLNTPIPPEGAETKSGKKEAAVSLQTWLALVKASGEKVMPDSDPVFDYAEQVGIPSEFLHLCWKEFRARYSQPNAKRYKDWRSVFRKAVRGNWLKLWWVDGDGAYALTTVGKQAEKAAA